MLEIQKMETNFEKSDLMKKLSRNSYFYDNKIDFFKGQNYQIIKNECLKSKTLFIDPFFEPKNQNIYYSKQVPRGIKWKVCLILYLHLRLKTSLLNFYLT
jgi:hypothetical protein